MKAFLLIVQKLSTFMNVIAGAALTFMIFITVADVVLRSFKRPILGTYEIVAFSGAVVMGFALPLTSWTKGHISVDLLVSLIPRIRKAFDLSTRVVGIFFFALSGVYLIKMGIKLYRTGEGSLTLQMPLYPIAYGVGICCFIVSLVMVCEIAKALRGSV